MSLVLEADGERSPLLATNGGIAVNNKDSQQDAARGISPRSAIVNIIMTMAGAGMLQLPWTLQQSGWAGGLIVFAAVAIISRYTSKLLIRIMNAQNVPVAGALNSFDDICRAAYGRAGVLLGEIAHKLILTGMCILFLVACARFFAEGLRDWVGDKNDADYIRTWTRKWVWATAAVVFVPSVAIRSMRDLASLGAVGLIGKAVTTLTVVAMSIYDHKHQNHDDCSSDAAKIKFYGSHDVFKYTGLATAAASVALCFAGHAVLPRVERFMIQPQLFSRLFDLGYLFVLLFYVPTLIGGYAAYGDETFSPILSNFPRCGGIRFVAVFTKLIISLHMILAYPLFSNVVLRKFEESVNVDHGLPSFRCLILRIIIRSIFVAGTALVAWALPYFAALAVLVGSTGGVMLVFILPPVLALRIIKTEMAAWEKHACLLIILLGLAIFGVGIYQSMDNLIHAASHHGAGAWGQ